MKADSAIEQLAEGRYRVTGDLSLDTAGSLLRKYPQFEGDSVELDLSTAGRTDSGGLALLLEWQARARKNNQQMHVSNPSPELLRLAALCDADDALGFENPEG